MLDRKILHIDDNLSWRQKQLAVQTALILGFHTEAVKFPIASKKEGVKIPASIEVLKGVCNYHQKTQMPKGYVAATDSAKKIPDFDWRPKKGLETMFGIGDLLKDENLDMLPDKLDFKIVLPRDSSTSMVIAACNFAFRFGMESSAIEGWILVSNYTSGNAVIFTEGEKCRMYKEEQNENCIVHIEGSGEELEEFSSKICEEFPKLGHFETWARFLQDMTDDFAMRNLNGQLAYLKAYERQGIKDCLAYVSPEINQRIEEVQELFPDIRFQNYKAMQQIYEKEYEIPWEVDVFRNLLKETVYPKLKPGDRVEILGALSEEKDIREKLKNEIIEEIKNKEADLESIDILCAYKQGFSWIDEKIIPDIKKLNGIQRLRIAFKQFLPEGVEEWNDENGATPSYDNTHKDPNRWFDLPIRYLQELYPIEDVLIENLSLELGQIEFVLYEGKEDITYECTALDEDGEEIYRGTYLAECATRSYLDDYPELGKVHPSTGYVFITINGKILLKKRIHTDVEIIWDIYQSKVLRDCRAFIEGKIKGGVKVEDQPFFAQLQLEVTASEPDYRLNSREDMISSLNALHEDMYFAGADYFKNYGLETCGKILDEPGLILPMIKKGTGKPKFKVRLFDQIAKAPGVFSAEDEIISASDRYGMAFYVKEVSYNKKKWSMLIKAEGITSEIAEAYMKLVEESIILKEQEFSFIDSLILEVSGKQYEARISKSIKKQEPLDIKDIDFLENTLIGYDQYMEIIKQLKRVPGIAVYRTAISYTGREIYAIELVPKTSGYISRTKRITNHPSEIINARHHANEVSSTNAAFILLKKLLTDSDFEDLADRLNLVIVPMENVDGAAIHYELQKDNPYWKLHVARFNAIGKEFYYEHFKSDTKHTEALGLTRLFETFLPDVIIDNHGVPSHEWEQQFSGYTSPSFKGFWLPRSLLYGYFWMVNNKEYKSNYDVNKKMEDVIANAISADSEMKRLNKEWARQFEIYAHKWMPKLFPANYYKDMINYWIPFEADESHRYPSIRFPWITSVAYTSEVADETAQGEYLNLCARAHVTHDIAIINMLINAKCIYENKAVITAENMKIVHTRLRPIIV